MDKDIVELIQALLSDLGNGIQEGSAFIDLFSIVQASELFSYLADLGFVVYLSLIFPTLFVLEIAFFFLKKHFAWSLFKVPLQMLVFNMAIGMIFPIALSLFLIEHINAITPFQTTLKWYWFFYAYLVWEFSHFLYHWLGHKVRIFWCLHSPHHAPRHMNFSVSFAHFFLEAPYADLIRITTCLLLGLSLEVLLIIRAIDGFYGSFIHISEESLKKGDFGFLGKLFLTPSHHRAHHAKNPLYIDTNFCNLLNIWDRLFGTYQELDQDTKPDYGIKRKMDPNSFVDVYFGEIFSLARDFKNTRGIINKFLLLILPPGWKPNTPALALFKRPT